ncbi:hypothetical protein B0J18DRAFT_204613 [Chaetomium sp. MPI-SDFR-AT-0129]|nr:hypothetical protein B0J18DRAFT_204613 [Chaetomium sp. MPI-SDFR-AT-0129]
MSPTSLSSPEDGVAHDASGSGPEPKMKPGLGTDWADGTESNGAATVTSEGAQATARPPPRKRRRIVISCTECHRRKQKCDRKFPCTNCVSRNKENSCRYETGAPTAKQHGRRATAAQSSNGRHVIEGQDYQDANTTTSAISLPTKAAATFGYSHATANTLGFLHHIETTNIQPDDDDDDDTNNTPRSDLDGTATNTAAPSPTNNSSPANTIAAVPIDTATRDRYKILIRQLPTRCAIEKLATLYFTEFNPHYGMVDRDVFDAQLAAWYRIPFSLLSTGAGPAALSAEMRAFPAVVFQMCAVGLLVVDDTDVRSPATCENIGRSIDGQVKDGVLTANGLVPDGEWLGELKYAGGMTFEDLAREYSDCSMEVLNVLGKRGMGVNTVLAGWMRASWLKYVGLVTEAWHAIGSAMRDAQEIGMHRDNLDPRPSSPSAEAILENQWLIQQRRRTWMTLVTWDIHMACVLGRPATSDLSMAPPSLPIDTPLPREFDRSRTPVLPRGDHDPPTPITRALWQYMVLRPLKEIIEMEKDGPCPKDFARVDRLHNELLDLDARMPAYFRLENPDTRFDALPECAWLPLSRVIMPQILTFELMALHRPYIFTRPKSRTEALKASLSMLNAQRLHFLALKPQFYKTFSLFFGTFDAIVLMASIYILFPKEHPDLTQRAIQHFHWAVERFEAMSERNSLAKSALGVLHAICVRMTKALGLSRAAAQKLLLPGSSINRPAGGDYPSHDGNINGSNGKHSVSAASPMCLTPSTTSPASYNPSPSMRSGTSLSTAITTPADEFSPQQQASNGRTPASHDTNTALSTVSSLNTNHVLKNSSTTDYNQTLSLNSTLNSTSAVAHNFDLDLDLDLDPSLFTINPSINDTNNNGSNSNSSFHQWNPPQDFDWSSLQPIYATSDLIYHNLSRTGPLPPRGDGPGYGNGTGGASGDGGLAWNGYQQQQQAGYNHGQQPQPRQQLATEFTSGDGTGVNIGTCPVAGEGGQGPVPAYCQFGGDFGDDSVWSLLNQYSPI